MGAPQPSQNLDSFRAALLPHWEQEKAIEDDIGKIAPLLKQWGYNVANRRHQSLQFASKSFLKF